MDAKQISEVKISEVILPPRKEKTFSATQKEKRRENTTLEDQLKGTHVYPSKKKGLAPGCFADKYPKPFPSTGYTLH